jgi:recombination protein RecR
MFLNNKALEDAVNAFHTLPGVGKKSALRMALYLLKQSDSEHAEFVQGIAKLKENVMFCNNCNNISEAPICNICKSPKRKSELICVVEDLRDVIAIENTAQFDGKYHVLGGLISPMDGVGPSDLSIQALVDRVAGMEVSEIVFALSATMEGDTTVHYLHKKLQSYCSNFSTIARGISFGGELEYVDELTLGRSIQARVKLQL